MATLNVMCAICSEFYKVDDVVFSTTICGHLFHKSCLFRWLDRSRSCPQCRRICHRSRVHQIYMNFGERSALDDEIDRIKADGRPVWIPLYDDQEEPADQEMLAGAVKAGTDPEGNDAYVARMYFNDDLLPASFVPKKGGAYGSWSCSAYFQRDNIELLHCCDVEWKAESNGFVPNNAIVSGYSEIGEKTYTGRAQYQDIMLPGKVHPSHGVMYMPYEGQEVNTKTYEVLVYVPKVQADK